MPLLIALLWLAVPAEANVRSVRIEAPAPGRFTPYVDIRPGHPLDAEAVRRAVELLHATGEFEEVVVEAERGSEGIDVVFRARRAPLLAGARVVGDRVLSPAALLKRGRLRLGEPLWPARLERAGRDAALAFVAAGYLEAVVSVETQRGPAGTELIFLVQAGARARVAAVRVEVSDGETTIALRDLVRPSVGDPYRKAQAERAAERMRRRLVTAGRWRATGEVQEKYDPRSARGDLTFAATSGGLTQLAVLGTAVSRSLHHGVPDIVRDRRALGDALH